MGTKLLVAVCDEHGIGGGGGGEYYGDNDVHLASACITMRPRAARTSPARSALRV
jgi:hypothetical protein